MVEPQRREQDGRRNRKLRNRLLNPRFQLKYTAMIVGIASLISLVLGLYLTSTLRENSRMLKLEAEFDDVLQSQLADSDAHIVWVMVGAFIVFIIVLAVMCVLVTHHMAGPIFVVQRHIREMGEGTLPRVRALRKGDEFVELLDTLSTAIQSIAERTRGEVAALEKMVGQLQGEARAEVEALLAWKKSMLSRLDQS
jgi:methyl-accepting chemotaxis protein